MGGVEVTRRWLAAVAIAAVAATTLTASPAFAAAKTPTAKVVLDPDNDFSHAVWDGVSYSELPITAQIAKDVKTQLEGLLIALTLLPFLDIAAAIAVDGVAIAGSSRPGNPESPVGKGGYYERTPTEVQKLAETGKRSARGDGFVTKAAQELDKHGGVGGFPKPTGNALVKNEQAQAILEEILYNPGTRTQPIENGLFVGGKYYIAPDGWGAAFDVNGVFQYFGNF
ncbi:hypothetical protein [Microbacterium sp. NPDC056052]|uniref:hypothetical protein n=1 Tax=Microbacterium sp. NPDC056052 TaxID=3345695 RepID=UPI0035DDC70A